MVVTVKFVLSNYSRVVTAFAHFEYEGATAYVNTIIADYTRDGDYVHKAIKIMSNENKVIKILRPLVQDYIERIAINTARERRHKAQVQTLHDAVCDANARNITFEVEV